MLLLLSRSFAKILHDVGNQVFLAFSPPDDAFLMELELGRGALSQVGGGIGEFPLCAQHAIPFRANGMENVHQAKNERKKARHVFIERSAPSDGERARSSQGGLRRFSNFY